MIEQFSYSSAAYANDGESGWLIRRTGDGWVRLATMCRCGVDLDPTPPEPDWWVFRRGTERDRERHKYLRILRYLHEMEGHRSCACGLCEWCIYRRWRSQRQ